MKLALNQGLSGAANLSGDIHKVLEAERLGLTPEDLARAIVADLLASPGEDFNAAAERVLKKNEDLYRRLA